MSKKQSEEQLERLSRGYLMGAISKKDYFKAVKLVKQQESKRR